MKHIILAASFAAIAAPVFAAGDVDAGKKAFNQCKSCHTIVDDEGTVVLKGGKTGPNLYGVIGRPAGSYDGFKYSKDLIAAGEAGLVWDEETFLAFSADPKKFLQGYLDKKAAKSKMTFKLRKGGEDLAAYLVSVAPLPVSAAEDETAADTAETTEDTTVSE